MTLAGTSGSPVRVGAGDQGRSPWLVSLGKMPRLGGTGVPPVLVWLGPALERVASENESVKC